MDLNQVTLPAMDVAASVQFYRTMGFEPLIVGPLYARFKATVGTTTFSIHAVEAGKTGALLDAPASGARASWSKIIVYFECAALDEQVELLKARGIQFTQEPRNEPWQWREARLVDPSGNLICLYHDNYGESRLHPPPWRGSGGS